MSRAACVASEPHRGVRSWPKAHHSPVSLVSLDLTPVRLEWYCGEPLAGAAAAAAQEGSDCPLHTSAAIVFTSLCSRPTRAHRKTHQRTRRQPLSGRNSACVAMASNPGRSSMGSRFGTSRAEPHTTEDKFVDPYASDPLAPGYNDNGLSGFDPNEGRPDPLGRSAAAPAGGLGGSNASYGDIVRSVLALFCRCAPEPGWLGLAPAHSWSRADAACAD